MNTKNQQALLRELLLGISDVSDNCRILHSESQKTPEPALFLRRGVVNLADDLESLVKEAHRVFGLGD